MGKADELLIGAIDMHCHGYPEFSLELPNRYSDEENVRLMKAAGMRGVVLKSHFWPTIPTARRLNEAIPDFEVFCGITLNHCVGGLKVWPLEAAVRQGAKVAWLPTWSARNDIRRGGMSHFIGQYLSSLAGLREEEGISLLDDEGKLTEDAQSVLAFVQEEDIPLFTAHVSPKESITLAREAKKIGYNKLVFNHPDSRSVGADFDQIVEMAELEASIEICALGLMPLYQRISPQELARIITRVGADKCILTTDYFFEWAPSVPEQLRLLITALLGIGIKEEDIKKMAQTNPAALLNLSQGGA